MPLTLVHANASLVAERREPAAGKNRDGRSKREFAFVVMSSPRRWHLVLAFARLGEKDAAAAYYERLVHEMKNHPSSSAQMHKRLLAQTMNLEKHAGFCVVDGDGTIHEAVNGLMRRDDRSSPPLGVIPGGTGNSILQHLDCVDALGPASRDPLNLDGELKAARPESVGAFVEGSTRPSYSRWLLKCLRIGRSLFAGRLARQQILLDGSAAN